jgi:lysophospholipase L1-like esterase
VLIKGKRHANRESANVRRTIRCALTIAAVAVPAGWTCAWPAVGLASRVPKLKLSPSSLSSAGGEVAMSSSLPGEAVCSITASPSYGGLPPSFLCGEGETWPYLSVPPNTGTGSDTYEYTVTATSGNGPTTLKPAKVTVAPAPANTYVALGDSYAAGQGNPAESSKPWVDRTGKPTNVLNGCNRSAVAYPLRVSKWLTRDSLLPSMSLRFLACSGATTEDVWDSGAYTEHDLEPPGGKEWQQTLDTADLHNARVVTVMIGGNDIGFANVLSGCSFPHEYECNPSSADSWIADLQQNIATLEPVLRETYQHVEGLAPNAALYVVGYPDLLPANASAAHEATCSAQTTISPEGIGYLIENQDRLDGAVQQAAEEAGAHFVNPNVTGRGGFTGHDVCAANPWFNWLSKPVEYSYHPNKAGQGALATDVEAAIAANDSASGGGDSQAKGTWTPEPLEVPNHGIGQWGLSSVACPAVRDCIAVGSAANENGSEALVEHWNGSTWHIEAVPPLLEHADDDLNAVSCASVASCVAVGFTEGGDVPYAVAWNGESWRSIPPKDDGTGGQLLSVSCASSSSCYGVGYYQGEPAYDHPLIERWNGTNWSVQAAYDPDPPGPNANNSELDAISCAGTTSCTAVGSAWAQTELGEPDWSYLTLAETTTNGSTWTQQSFSDLPETFGAPLRGVSCVQANDCVAVGSNSNKDNPFVSNMLAGQWNGAVWTPYLLSGGEGLWSVSCASGSWCLAAGLYGQIDTWNGVGWVENTPIPGDYDTAVACVSETECMAVGSASEAYLYSG